MTENPPRGTSTAAPGGPAPGPAAAAAAGEAENALARPSSDTAATAGQDGHEGAGIAMSYLHAGAASHGRATAPHRDPAAGGSAAGSGGGGFAGGGTGSSDHPDLEELAAFADGALPAERQPVLMAHLARCADCFELFAGTAQFLAEERAAAGQESSVDGSTHVAHGADELTRPFDPPAAAEPGSARPPDLGSVRLDAPAPQDPAVLPAPGSRWRRGGDGRPARRSAWRWAAAIAAALVVTAGLALTRWYLESQVGIPTEHLAALVADEPIDVQAGSSRTTWVWPIAMRGGTSATDGQSGSDLSYEQQAFRLGVRDLDLRLALRRGDQSDAELAIIKINQLLSQMGISDDSDITKRYQALRTRIGDARPASDGDLSGAPAAAAKAETRTKLAALLPEAAEAAGDQGIAPQVEKLYYQLGAWTETCRLGAAGAAAGSSDAARDSELFTGRAVRQMIEQAMKEPPPPQTPARAADDGRAVTGADALGGAGGDLDAGSLLRQIHRQVVAGRSRLSTQAVHDLGQSCEQLLNLLDAER